MIEACELMLSILANSRLDPGHGIFQTHGLGGFVFWITEDFVA
jgi:hypothetical protein